MDDRANRRARPGRVTRARAVAIVVVTALVCFGVCAGAGAADGFQQPRLDGLGRARDDVQHVAILGGEPGEAGDHRVPDG